MRVEYKSIDSRVFSVERRRCTPPMLTLTPETEADQEALKLLVDNHDDGYGFGRCPETGKVLHAEIYLRARVELSSLSVETRSY